MDLCIIGYEKSESNLRLLEEAKNRFDKVFFVPIDSIGVGLLNSFSITYRAADLLRFGAVFPRIPRKFCSYAYQLLSLFPQETYMPIKPISFLLADERFFLLTVLRKRNIPTLKLQLARSPAAATRLISAIKFPFIIRTPEKKTGVIVNSESEAKNIIGALSSLKKPVLIEELVKDMISVYVAEPEAIAAVRKKTKEMDVVFGEGEMKKQKINSEIEHIALDAARAIEAQVARIDLTLTPEPKIVNVELNPNLTRPSKVTGVNLPGKIINSIHENYKAHTEKPMLIKFFEDAKSVVKDVLKTKQMM
jgi:glutathione synthase/RimK-type ligase-like ATP-grasp enzyme